MIVSDNGVHIEAAGASDFAALCSLLRAADLPTDGLAPDLTAFVAREGHEVVGGVALERHESVALLRSLVVAPSHQGFGLGKRLVEAVVDFARRERIETLYLLTTTADGFFARHFAFRAVQRSLVPASVQQSAEFRGACPDTARAMTSKVCAKRT